jgi:Fe-S cluster assembly ATP-binding protein
VLTITGKNMLLEVKNLSVEVSGKPILKDINLSIDNGEALVLFGPNGSGKSTLIKAIMGFDGYRVTAGEIIFKKEKINNLPIEDRVRLGLGIMYQHPPMIRGVKLSQVARYLSKDEIKIQALAERLLLGGHMEREINVGFSGGEMKRSELFQLLMQNPDLLLLDEPESGVDLENICNMGQVLNEYLKKEGRSTLMITHTGYILDYVQAKRGCVMMGGNFWCVGDPKEMFESIRQSGYDKCRECVCPQKS